MRRLAIIRHKSTYQRNNVNEYLEKNLKIQTTKCWPSEKCKWIPGIPIRNLVLAGLSCDVSDVTQRREGRLAGLFFLTSKLRGSPQLIPSTFSLR